MRYKKLDKTLPDIKQHTDGSAGIDLFLRDNTTILPKQTVTVGTGVAIEIPEGYVGVVVPRSSTGELGITLANTVGIIDCDYRGEVKLKIHSASKLVELKKFQRVVQLVIVPYLSVELVEVDDLTTTERGSGGFGSTNDNKKKVSGSPRKRKVSDSSISKGK